MQNWIVVDAENTTWSKGDPYDLRNFNVCWSWWDYQGTHGVSFEGPPDLKDYNLLIGFNLAYDLAWLWKKGIDTTHLRFYCCQVAEYLLTNQTQTYPSLDSTALKYLNRQKLDVVKTEYWDKGINTDQIPKPILAEYAQLDSELTAGIYLKQQEIIPDSKRTLISLAMQDMVVLAEIRANGSRYDVDLSKKRAQELDEEITAIQRSLDLFHSLGAFNWASGDHVSALLYGGTITIKEQELAGEFKTGAKVGQKKYRWIEKQYHFPRLYKPLPRTELAKGGVWSTSEDILVKLDDGKPLISGLLKIRELSKLRNTYFRGFPERMEEHHWPTGYIHSTFNQTSTLTGRLSSEKPNLQNVPPPGQECFISRWD